MAEQNYTFGMIGLGVMGRNLMLNMAEHGVTVNGYDKNDAQVQEVLKARAGGARVNATGDLQAFVNALAVPRVMILLVPAGRIVDDVIHDLIPLLSSGDLIIDAGNSLYKDTDLRAKTLAAKGLLYMGVGVSGGEDGARHGPSLMPGGPPEAYARVKNIFEAVAAHVDGAPCVTYLGAGSAGHYVKMVHNGIEYGLMQLIAETYDLMKRGLKLNDDEIAAVYSDWNTTELNSFLIEITARIFRQVDDQTGKRLIDLILDEAKQKGTGMWTSQDAMDLQAPIPVIDAAVAARNLSVVKIERDKASRVYQVPVIPFQGDRKAALAAIKEALHTAMIITYAQGFVQLQSASNTYGYRLALADVARIWRGGCIIRAALLEKITAAFQAQPDLTNLLLDPQLSQIILDKQDELRAAVILAVSLGLPVPGMMAALAYLDSYRSAWLPANLIQAQRDDFGAHTYEREDARGVFHTHWE